VSRRRSVATLVGMAALVVGLALLVAVIASFAASRCDGGEASTGTLAMRSDAVTDQTRGTTVPRVHRAHRPSRPVRIQIPAIGVDAPIVPLGLDPDRMLQVPRNFGDAGWWTGGARPGEAGPAIIVGHIDSHTGPAVFFRIGELGRGAAIIVVRRDRSRARFTVIGSERYPKSDFPTARVYGPTAEPALRLITCSGAFDRASGHYVDNTVVYAAGG
jgi:hypothetical protein